MGDLKMKFRVTTVVKIKKCQSGKEKERTQENRTDSCRCIFCTLSSDYSFTRMQPSPLLNCKLHVIPKLFTISLLRKVAMNKFKKSQILMLSVVAALLFIAPLLSSSSRPSYLYFVLNLLIIALGTEAGVLSVFSRPAYVAAKPVTTQEAKAVESKDNQKQVAPASNEKKVRVVAKSGPEKIVGTVKVETVNKCSSSPSLFFIGSGETEAEAVDEEHEEKEEGEEEELFVKAETFIGNFYNQLKMQKEESWKRIHGIYQKAF